jgi:hypothetical protein
VHVAQHGWRRHRERVDLGRERPQWREPPRAGRRVAQERAALDLAADFQTWQTPSRGGGLSRDQAVELMVRAIRCAGRAT